MCGKIIKGHEALRPRGPDCGSLTDGVLGFRRLSIVDTSTHGNQPFQLGRVRMMCNGEIYNHKAVCESGSDCEIIIRLYEKISQLDGVFAIVLTDGDDVFIGSSRLHLALAEQCPPGCAHYSKINGGLSITCLRFQPSVILRRVLTDAVKKRIGRLEQSPASGGQSSFIF
jgi:hypothetical protein